MFSLIYLLRKSENTPNKLKIPLLENEEQSKEIELLKRIVRDETSPETKAKEALEPLFQASELSASTWTHQAYFIVRSALMSLISAIMMLTAVWYLGRVDVLQAFLIGTIGFAASLAVSRLFDPAIYRVTSRIVKRLGEHKRLRDLILKNF